MRGLRRARIFGVLLTVLAILGLIAPAAASAGTLTSATFTSSGTGYAVTGASNVAYNYGFTTATSGTVSRVTATVPAGTTTQGPQYLAQSGFNAGSQNYASAPYAPVMNTTTALDLRVKLSMDWNETTDDSYLMGRWQGGSYGSSYAMYENNGNFGVGWNDGTANHFSGMAAKSLTLVPNTTAWLRATIVPDNGTGNSVVVLYTSLDGTNWTLIKTNVAAVSTFNTGSSQFEVGSILGGSYGYGSARKTYFASASGVINGTTSSPSGCTAAGVVACFNADDDTTGAASWSSSSPQHETWTVNRSTPNLPADIATDLVASGTSGIPAGGVASYRRIDNFAVYVLPTATSVAASTPCTVSFGGFNNTSTAGSYTSTVKTVDGSGSAIDSAVTTALTFAPTAALPLATATIDPTFTFAVAGQSSVCNGESNFLPSAGSINGIALGHLGLNSNASGSQSLTVTSNAGAGFTVFIRGAQLSQNLRSSIYSWTDVSGTYASPAPLGSGEAFGYTYKDSTASSSVANPATATFVGLDGTNRAVTGSATSPSGTGCISFDAKTGSATPAANYLASILYTAVPTF